MGKDVITFAVDGLNIDDNGFRWKERLMLTNSKRKYPNIALAAIINEEGVDYSESVESAHHFLNLFLACYQLTNTSNPIPMPGFVIKHWTGDESFEAFVRGESYPYEYVSSTPKLHETDVMRNLQQTLPMFEKVISVVESGKVPGLETALGMYYRSVITMESIEDFIGMVTVLEALFSDGEELKYKLALRTALMIKDKMSYSRVIFDEVSKIYKKRSELVHGDIIPIRFRKELIPLKMAATTYAKFSLLGYVELAAKGMTKKKIIEMLDNRALGLESSPPSPDT